MAINRLPEYQTKLFCDIYDNADDFAEDYNNCGIPAKFENPNTINTLFYLLYARYGNNPIANWDEEQWKYKLFSIIFMYGPTWEKRLAIQDRLRTMDETELQVGSKQIFNRALNPETPPDTASLEELTYINEQNTNNYKRGVLESYSTLWELLKVDVTNEFLGKFIVLFKKFVRNEKPLIYVTETEEGE